MLSKSKYVAGLQCHKRLWLQKKRPELAAPVDAATQARFDQGQQVGELAQQLFPGGREMAFPADRRFGPMLQATQAALADELPAIYEAAFAAAGVLVLCDILQKRGSGFACYEVKSSVEVKSYHLDDAAIQYYVLQQAGLPLEAMYVLTLNRAYYREEGELDLEQLFVAHEVTEEVLARQSEIPGELAAMQAMLEEAEPALDIGRHCHSPFVCEFKAYCWPELPDPSVFDIPRFRDGWELLAQGRTALDQLGDTPLSPKQAQFVEAQLSGREHLDRRALGDWLNGLRYPLYFLDFETVKPVLPLWSHTRPHQPHLAVQYSVHRVDGPGAEAEHREYLADFSGDFRADLVAHLLADLGESGTILAYNQSFEVACLRNLAQWESAAAPAIEALLGRVQDLILPFRQGWYRKPEMRGSASIKAVYPALFPAAPGYAAQVIKDGGEAQHYLNALAQGRFRGSPAERRQLESDLRAYCRLDTQAMVEIWRHLGALASA